MPIVVDISEADIVEIDAIAIRLGLSRRDFVRRAIAASLLSCRESVEADAFGILRGKLPDGSVYQEKLRREWN